ADTTTESERLNLAGNSPRLRSWITFGDDKSGEIGKARPANSLDRLASFSSLQLLFAARKRFAILPLPINSPSESQERGERWIAKCSGNAWWQSWRKSREKQSDD